MVHQDGSIECEVRATGIMVTSHTAAPGSRPENGTLVDQGIYAPFHQHFIVARLDLDVDETGNTVYATESKAAAPASDDPYALGLTVTSTPLRTEAEGKQDYDWGTQRGWKVVNDNVTNGLGTPVGYKLIPSATFPPLLDPASPAFKRAQVIGHTLWGRRTARTSAGRAATSRSRPRAGDTGLPAWTAANRPIENTTVALKHEAPRHPPGGPAGDAGGHRLVLAQAVGFFDRNPALDVPPSSHC